MQRLDIFQNIYKFFIISKLNPNYVKNIDQQIKNDQQDESTKLLIQSVQEFHKMRQTLCSKVFTFFEDNELLYKFINASGIRQYDSVPQNSTCIFTKQKIKQDQGILIILNCQTQTEIYTVHKRFKRVLYNFWYLVHFTDEINLELTKWLTKQHWWSTGLDNKDIVERILCYQDNVFVKKSYVKLKSIGQYIQTEMVSLPINHT